jgi:hypothetical protein
MPKKTKSAGGRGAVKKPAQDLSGGSDEEGSVYNEAGSVSSLGISEASTYGGGEADDTISAEEQFEGKMKDAMDLATEKSAATRIKGIDMLYNGLLKRYIPDFIEGRRATIIDIVEKSLKKGKGGEITAASKLALLLGVQLIDASEVYQELHVLLLQMLTDKTQTTQARSSVALCVSGLCFIAGGDLAEVVRVMHILESIFIASMPNQEGSVAKVNAEMSGVHASCLSGWALLSTLLSPGQIYETINRHLQVMRGLLSSTDVELRITAGETMALLLEAAYDHDEDYVPDNFTELLSELKQLSTDSSKSKSKKDRKEQRSSFRDVLRAVEEAEQPAQTIKFGKETLRLESWFSKIQYDWFCKMMGTGINTHLSTNLMLREIFELGPTMNQMDADSHKLTKTQRNAANQQAFKARTQQRSKHRDKRSAVY